MHNARFKRGPTVELIYVFTPDFFECIKKHSRVNTLQEGHKTCVARNIWESLLHLPAMQTTLSQPSNPRRPALMAAAPVAQSVMYRWIDQNGAIKLFRPAPAGASKADR